MTLLFVYIATLLACFSLAQHKTIPNDYNSQQKIQVDRSYEFEKVIEQNWDVGPLICKLVAYDIIRAQQTFQIEVSYGENSCSDKDFYVTELLTPVEYVKSPFESLELPLFICQAQIEVVEIPDMLLQTKNVFWEEGSNYSFIELQNGYGMYDQFTCYQGQKFQLLGNNCKNQSAQVKIRLDSGGNEDMLADAGCVEASYVWYSATYGFIAVVILILNCGFCCCLFCDCCLPCARIVRAQTFKMRSVRQIEMHSIRQQDTAYEKHESDVQQEVVTQRKKKEARERAAITTMEGQSRSLTFFLAVGSALMLWFYIFPQNLEFDPYRVDYVDNNYCRDISGIGDSSPGYIQTLCKFINVFIMSLWFGVGNFVILLPNYTNRTDPWYRLRLVIAAATLFCCNLLSFLGVGQLSFRWEYLKQQASVYYIVIIAGIHLIIADILFIKVIILGKGRNMRHCKLERTWIIKNALQGYNEDAYQEEIEDNNDNNDPTQPQQSRIGDLFKPLKNFFIRQWNLVKEEPGFRYNVFMLVAVFAAGYVIVFIFIKLTYSRIDLLNCLKDFDGCVQHEMEKYIVFVSDNVGIDELYPIAQHIIKRPGSVSDVDDTISEITNATQSFSTATEEVLSGLENVTNAVRDVQQMCDMFNITELYSMDSFDGRLFFAQWQQVCQTMGSSEVQAALFNLEQVNENVDALQETNKEVMTMLDQAETIERQSEELMVRVSSNENEWSDKIDVPFQVASSIGFMVGLVMGLSVLYITLVSYKRISIHLTLDKALKIMKGPQQQQIEHDNLQDQLERFSIVSAIYFFGIVLSTSAIQMYIFSFFLTFCLTVLFSPWMWTVFLKKYYGYVIVYGGMLIINAVVVRRIGFTLLDGKHAIKRPALWLAYYIIFSFAYLLLGLLFAVWRILYLLLTTLISINRLDITIFTTLTGLDNGHNSFMGMVLMAQAMNNIGYTRPKLSAAQKWARLRSAVRANKRDLLQKVRDSVLPNSSLFQDGVTVGLSDQEEEEDDDIFVDVKQDVEIENGQTSSLRHEAQISQLQEELKESYSSISAILGNSHVDRVMRKKSQTLTHSTRSDKILSAFAQNSCREENSNSNR